MKKCYLYHIHPSYLWLLKNTIYDDSKSKFYNIQHCKVIFSLYLKTPSHTLKIHSSIEETFPHLGQRRVVLNILKGILLGASPSFRTYTSQAIVFGTTISN
jgi:hypothetical protein